MLYLVRLLHTRETTETYVIAWNCQCTAVMTSMNVLRGLFSLAQLRDRNPRFRFFDIWKLLLSRGVFYELRHSLNETGRFMCISKNQFIAGARYGDVKPARISPTLFNRQYRIWYVFVGALRHYNQRKFEAFHRLKR